MKQTIFDLKAIMADKKERVELIGGFVSCKIVLVLSFLAIRILG